ncbi:MAG: type B 50S ribosomal protein L31 [Burkholderiales bacterium]|nr:type B 50S ribosomal protein L31 [Burkholderiales bacterium]
MKQGIHPEYREVVFQDMQIDFKFITRSTAPTRETIELDGRTYPLIKLDTSSESHPFYTGAQTRIVETGRVEKFRQKFAAKTEQVNAAAAEAVKAKESAPKVAKAKRAK